MLFIQHVSLKNIYYLLFYLRWLAALLEGDRGFGSDFDAFENVNLAAANASNTSTAVVRAKLWTVLKSRFESVCQQAPPLFAGQPT